MTRFAWMALQKQQKRQIRARVRQLARAIQVPVSTIVRVLVHTGVEKIGLAHLKLYSAIQRGRPQTQHLSRSDAAAVVIRATFRFFGLAACFAGLSLSSWCLAMKTVWTSGVTCLPSSSIRSNNMSKALGEFASARRGSRFCGVIGVCDGSQD